MSNLNKKMKNLLEGQDDDLTNEFNSQLKNLSSIYNIDIDFLKNLTFKEYTEVAQVATEFLQYAQQLKQKELLYKWKNL